MRDELYADGIGEITVTGSIVRIDMVSLSATERDEKNAPRTELRQRIIMPLDGFANAVDLMHKALAGLVEAGAVRRIGDIAKADGEIMDAKAPPAPVTAGGPNTSPNFN